MPDQQTPVSLVDASNVVVPVIEIAADIIAALNRLDAELKKQTALLAKLVRV